nr:helix-turn-helix domain-containing protein [Candidatus Freyarchaeota archaeon]
MKQSESTSSNRNPSFLLFRKRLEELTPQDLEGLSEYARRNLEIIRCWHLNPLEDILRAYQISKSWFFRLIKKFTQGGAAALEDRRGRPSTARKDGGGIVGQPVQELIIKLKKGDPQLGSRRIEDLIGSECLFSHMTIHRLLKREGLVELPPTGAAPPSKWCEKVSPTPAGTSISASFTAKIYTKLSTG